MTAETISQFATDFDDIFFLIGGAILVIELLTALFTGAFRGRAVLDMIASASTQIPSLLVEAFLMSFLYVGMVMFADGSTHFINDSVDLLVWAEASSMREHELIDEELLR